MYDEAIAKPAPHFSVGSPASQTAKLQLMVEVAREM
jgi:hypothetical protein